MEAVAGLDIGSSHIVAAVSVPSGPVVPLPEGIKVGFCGALGFRKGQVSDPAALSRSIGEAIGRAEAASGAKVGTVCIGLPGHTVEFFRNRYSNLIGKRRINRQDIERVNRLAMVSDLPPGRRIIQAIPLEYVVDGVPADGDPLGMHCSRLEVESLMITAESSLVDRLVEAFHGSGAKCRIADILPSTLAGGRVILNDAQQKLGAALVDMGGSCTGVLVFNHGYPLGFEALPVGGDHITSDLAVCLRTTLEGAEEIKRTVGLGPGKAPDAGDGDGPGAVIIPRLSGSGYNEVPVKNVVEVIEARVCEILELVGASVNRITGGLDLPGGLVIAGGGSRLAGLELFALELLGQRVRLGIPGTGDDLHRQVNTAGAMGLLEYMLNSCLPAEADHRPPPGLWDTIRRIFKVAR